MSNLWCACLTTDTRCPSRLSAGISAPPAWSCPNRNSRRSRRPSCGGPGYQKRSSVTVLGDVCLHVALGIGRQLDHALGQRLDAFELRFGRSGSWPSASTMVAANLIGSAVSSTTIGTPGTSCSRATFRPSAVWVSISVPKRLSVSRMVARRSACVLLAAHEAEALRGRLERRVGAQVEAALGPSSSTNSRRSLAPSRPSRSNTKRSKLLALEMSIDGLEVSCVSARRARGRCRCGRTRRARRSRWWRPPALRSAGPSCAPRGRRRRCRSCPRAR
jgi:hypothetical protein